MAGFQTHPARLVRSVPLSELTKHLEFEMPAISRFGFVPGQWLSFQQVKPDGDELRHQGRQLWLLFGNRTEKDIYYHDEFLGLAAEHPNFHYCPTLSRGSTEWQVLRGYVQDHVAGLAKGRSDMQAYICGLDKMVKANRELLKALGWDSKSIS